MNDIWVFIFEGLKLVIIGIVLFSFFFVFWGRMDDIWNGFLFVFINFWIFFMNFWSLGNVIFVGK